MWWRTWRRQGEACTSSRLCRSILLVHGVLCACALGLSTAVVQFLFPPTDERSISRVGLDGTGRDGTGRGPWTVPTNVDRRTILQIVVLSHVRQEPDSKCRRFVEDSAERKYATDDSERFDCCARDRQHPPLRTGQEILLVPRTGVCGGSYTPIRTVIHIRCTMTMNADILR